MSEVPTTPAAPAATFVNTNPLALDAGQTAAMREQWVSLGLDPTVFDQHASGQVPTAPAASPAPAVQDPNAPAAVEVLSDTKTPGLTPAQAQDMAAEMIRVGMPREQVEAALKADGYTLARETRTDEQIEWDRAFAPGAPRDYRIDYMGRAADLDPAQLAQANAEATQWLAAVGFPPEIGPAVIERAMDVGQALTRMSEPERELWSREQTVLFARMAGSEERYRELIGLAADALARGNPAYAALLRDRCILADAGVLMHLAHQGERLKARA